MMQLMYFKRNAIYFNNLTISTFALIFFIYGMFRTKAFVNYYSKKFYLVFVLHFVALILNGAHAIIIQHDVLHVTFLTEFSMFLVLLCLYGLILFWTYNFYLKYIYMSITGTRFKSFKRLLYWLVFWKRKYRDSYDYQTVSTNADSFTETENDDTLTFYEQTEEITESGWFRYMNYQILGNYLFSQVFNIFALLLTYLVRSIASSLNLNATTQLTMISLGIICFNVSISFFDFKYRRFTKSLIMPHLTLLILMMTWMFEYYQRFNNKQPEALSVICFISIFIYIVVKFAFLTEVASIENVYKYNDQFDYFTNQNLRRRSNKSF